LLAVESGISGSLHGRISKRLNHALLAYWRDTEHMAVRASFMANARQLQRTWPEVITAGSNNLIYDAYMQMAVCRLQPEQKRALRAWAEATRRDGPHPRLAASQTHDLAPPLPLIPP
jgi:hypothetical protein